MVTENFNRNYFSGYKINKKKYLYNPKDFHFPLKFDNLTER